LRVSSKSFRSPHQRDGGTERTRPDLLHALTPFLCIWCASCGALAPPFPRKGLAPSSLILRLRCRLPAGDDIDTARSLKGTLHESKLESKEQAASASAGASPAQRRRQCATGLRTVSGARARSPTRRRRCRDGALLSIRGTLFPGHKGHNHLRPRTGGKEPCQIQWRSTIRRICSLASARTAT